MTNLGRQLEAEVEAALEGEVELANELQRQNLVFDELQRNRNMGRPVVGATQEHVRQRIRDAFKPDATYRSAWNKFKNFVDEKRRNGEIDDGNITNYLTSATVDAFFVQVVSKMNVTPRHAKRFSSALQKYADNVEHIGNSFVVKSENVLECLDAQKNYKLDQDSVVQERRPGASLPCPHMGLRVNLCTPDKDVQFMEYVYTHAPEIVSYKLSFCWTIGRTTFLRGQSLRILLYYNIFTSDVFGPEPKHDSNKHCVMIVLRKGTSPSWLIVVLFLKIGLIHSFVFCCCYL